MSKILSDEVRDKVTILCEIEALYRHIEDFSKILKDSSFIIGADVIDYEEKVQYPFLEFYRFYVKEYVQSSL